MAKKKRPKAGPQFAAASPELSPYSVIFRSLYNMTYVVVTVCLVLTALLVTKHFGIAR